MEDFELDLLAVVQRLELSRFVLMAHADRGHTAVRYSVSHPNRLDALVLVHSGVSAREIGAPMFRDLARHNWEVLLRNASPGEGWDEAQRRDVTERFRQSVTQADFLAAGEAYAESDISSLLPQLNVPTLVLHARGNIHAKLDGSMRLAALIPEARLALIDGHNYFGDAEQGVQAISSFLESVGEHEESAPGGPSTVNGLSEREREILALLASGESNKQIALRLSLSLSTVNHHVSNIYAKIEAPNRAAATAYALRHGIA
jgi:DNA-binding CsgD family transcriptional regulator/pimeloyl-ACP methyl ester carboxylesterase